MSIYATGGEAATMAPRLLGHETDQRSLRRVRPDAKSGAEVIMSMPISLQLDDQSLQTLETEAQARNVDLSAYLRQIATEEARRIRRERIREQSRVVAEYVASNPEAAAFYEDWGSSNPICGG